ncbi:Peptidase propeptide and YPEB domain protein [Clostridiales bacterium CHKCI001]|nr:Peptidase propeptide and YPEB domain protein [Clostridiales bacterium CHKCI001]
MRKRFIKVAAIIGLVSICASGCTTQTQGTTPETTTPAAVAENNSQSSSAGQQETTPVASSDATTPVQETTPVSSSADAAQGAVSGEITEEEAKAIAFQNAQVIPEEVTAIRVKRDIDDGIPVYDVEFYVQNKEYDYEIQAADGAILSVDYDVEEDFQTSANTAGVISEAEAKQIILNRLPEATEQNIYIRLDTDDGMQEYEGEVVVNNTKYEFEINAQTGEITNWEQD